MLDFKKYTKMCQLGDKINRHKALIEAGKSNNLKVLSRLEEQYEMLYKELGIADIEVKVDLENYLDNCLRVLNSTSKGIGEKWTYAYHILSHNDNTGGSVANDQKYDKYKYQVILMRGNKKIPVCVVDRELQYFHDNDYIDFVTDDVRPPFNLRLDQFSPQLDGQTNELLKMESMKSVLEYAKTKKREEISLIQRRIMLLQQELSYRQQESEKIQSQLDNLNCRAETKNGYNI